MDNLIEILGLFLSFLFIIIILWMAVGLLFFELDDDELDKPKHDIYD